MLIPKTVTSSSRQSTTRRPSRVRNPGTCVAKPTQQPAGQATIKSTRPNANELTDLDQWSHDNHRCSSRDQCFPWLRTALSLGAFSLWSSLPQKSGYDFESFPLFRSSVLVGENFAFCFRPRALHSLQQVLGLGFKDPWLQMLILHYQIQGHIDAIAHNYLLHNLPGLSLMSGTLGSDFG
jgi:hypothetical protein